MKIPGKHLHSWRLSPAAARDIQARLSGAVKREDDFGVIRTAAGIDVGFENGRAVTRAAVVVLGLPGLEVRETAIARIPTVFPYIPGLLSFREIPAVLKALEKLRTPPDLLICDGHGIAHPRRLGLASHLGVLVDLPAIGAAKNRLIGTHTAVPGRKGAWVKLMDKEEVIGAVLRTRDNVKPIYVSIGHRVSLPSCIRLLNQCITRYRLPETTRIAHNLASRR